MTVNIFKPNQAAIQAQLEAQKARAEQRKAQAKSNRQGDLLFGEFHEGDNYVRALPAMNSTGIVGKQRGTHFFQRTPLKGVLEKGQYECLFESFPQKHDCRCAFHEAGDWILQQNPSLDLSMWLNPGVKTQMYLIHRSSPDAHLREVAQIFDINSSVYNWFLEQQAMMLGRGFDITDVEQGLDFIVRQEIVQKNYKGNVKQFKNYEGAHIPLASASPLHPDPAIRDRILSQVKDLDEVFKYPDDAKMAEFQSAADKVKSFYIKSEAKANPNVQVPGNFGQRMQPTAPFVPQTASAPVQHVPTPAAVMAPAPLPQTPQYPSMAAPVPTPSPVPSVPPTAPTAAPQGFYQPPPAPVVAQATAVAQQFAASVAQQFAPPPPSAPTPHPALQLVPPAPAQPALFTPPPAQQQLPIPMVGNAQSPQDMPACFAGKSPRPDGGFGYSPDQECCLVCRAELKCMEVCKQLQLGGS